MLIQLLAISSETAVDNSALMDAVEEDQNANLDKIDKSIEIIFFKTNDIKAEIKQHVKNSIEPAFNGCKNNITPMSSNSTYECIEKCCQLCFDSSEIFKILEMDPSYKNPKTLNKKRKVGGITLLNEIYKILVEKGAIPTVKVGDKLAFSLNGIIKYLFYSLYVLIGEKTFNESKEIKEFTKAIKHAREKINELLKELYSNGKFVGNVENKHLKIINDASVLLDSNYIDEFLKHTKFEGTTEIQEKRISKLYTLISIVLHGHRVMLKYILVHRVADVSLTLVEFEEFTIDFILVIYNLIVFSVPYSKRSDFITALNNTGKSFDFSIFDPIYGDFDENDFGKWAEISKLISGDTDGGSSTISVIGIASVVVFLVGGVGAFIYFRRKKD